MEKGSRVAIPECHGTCVRIAAAEAKIRIADEACANSGAAANSAREQGIN